jgi:prevent-host-death family protein
VARIPQRELRNNVSDVLRRAEGGERFTITVDGRPVAELGPIARTRNAADADDLARVFADTRVDDGWPAELARTREEDREAARDPWSS